MPAEFGELTGRTKTEGAPPPILGLNGGHPKNLGLNEKYPWNLGFKGGGYLTNLGLNGGRAPSDFETQGGEPEKFRT